MSRSCNDPDKATCRLLSCSLDTRGVSSFVESLTFLKLLFFIIHTVLSLLEIFVSLNVNLSLLLLSIF